MHLPTRCSVVLAIAAIACRGHGTPAPPTPPHAIGTPSPFAAPPPIDPAAPGAAYLTSIALQLQPPWAQFLEDCHLRLPSTHPLNDLALVATADLAIDRGGALAIERFAGSASPDFDRAVRGVIGDAQVASPPVELLADDDRLHVRWSFARDRRQAGPATAVLLEVHRPVVEVVDRLIARGELVRAARRAAEGDPDEPAREVAAEHVVVAVLDEALAGANASTRRQGLVGVGRARLLALAPAVRARLAPTIAADVRVVAIETAGLLGDRAAAPLIHAALAVDLADPRLAIADVVALTAVGDRDVAAAAVAKALAELPHGHPSRPPRATELGALAAFARVPTPALVPALVRAFDGNDARTRAALCEALATDPGGAGVRAMIGRGLDDPDATVRATCVAAAARAGAAYLPRLRVLARDRDRGVRAQAVAALVVASPESIHAAAIIDDDAPEVRTAFAAAHPRDAEAALRRLAGDRDPDVRAAALGALGDRAPELVARGLDDAAPQVRRAAVAVANLAAPDVVAKLDALAHDNDDEVASEALVRATAREGRRAALGVTMARVIEAPPASSARVRAALAWLLAR